MIPDAKLPRNAFDRSVTVNQSARAGELDIVFAQPFTRGSHVKLNRRVFSRTAEVNTAAFTVIDQHVEFFAVPINFLWSYWDNYKLQIRDYNSTALSAAYASPNAGIAQPVTVPYFDYHQFITSDLSSWSLSERQDDLYYNFGNGALRLFDAIGISQKPFLGIDYNNVKNNLLANPLACNLFKLAAYQKVYYDHFRNTLYESNNPFAYNLDWITRDKSGFLDLTDTDCRAAFALLARLRYVDYRKDYFKNAYPSLNYSANVDSVTTFDIPSSVIYQYSSNRPDSILKNQSSVAINSPVYSSSVAHTVQSIRAAFALDKLLRHVSYAGKHVNQQVEARFGVKANSRDSFESVRIGQFMNDVVIGEVTSMANTDNGISGDRLGKIGGKGIGSADFGHDLEFTCTDDCIIIGVSYFIPRTSYDASGIDNWNMKLQPEDFFVPEMMDLGLQPVYFKEIQMYVGNDGGFYRPNDVLFYQPRYSEYKLGIDKNLGAFRTCMPEFSANAGGSITAKSVSGALQQFVVHSDETNSSINSNFRYFKVDPKDLDSIFVSAQDYVAQPNNDQFFSDYVIKCVSNQNMSVHGQPSF